MARNTAGQTLVYNASQGTPAFANGKNTTDGTSLTATDYIEVTVGFKPKYVQWLNITDQVGVEWYEGMADNTSFKTIANGTRTIETTNGGITPTNNGFRVTQNATLAAVVASKVNYWQARA